MQLAGKVALITGAGSGIGKAAALLFSICQNHALLDGNKRLAWAAAVTFLALNGIPVPRIDVDAALDLAAPDEGWAVEQVSLSTHNGTHLDAPWHFHPTMNRGERSWTIDEVPLEWCLQPGVKLDFRHFADGYVATAKDVEAELKRKAVQS